MTRTLFLTAGAVVLSAGGALAQSTPDYTGSLNSMPPGAARPVETPPPPQAATPTSSPTPAPTPVTAPPRPQAAPPTSSPTPTAVTAPPRPQAASPEPRRTEPTPTTAAVPPAPSPTTVPAVSAPAATPRVLTRAEIEALPFAIALPEGYVLTAGRPGPDFQVWTVRKGGLAQLMIYAGPASQFPIHTGEQVVAGGRTSIVVVEDGRRRALEHLFQQSTAPHHIHVWVASLDGADRDRAEALAHGVSPR
ncbi:hypothetical protein [Brevundimonas sp.]|jgi:hypothetical protein|uniref:hypothetical protein n=1 Tax=Brevundimonas sp. TaxID=1871086 RepID=UPI002E0DEF76|nr:hypothetical protein [Brevundimonas sp.]